MVTQCPVTTERTGQTATRISAFFVFTALFSLMITQSPWIILLLAADFALRGFGYAHISPIARASTALVSALSMTDTLIDAGPKRFAARLGLTFSLVISALFITGSVAGIGMCSAAACGMTAILALFSGLEAFLGYCVGCQLYSMTSGYFPQRIRTDDK